MPTNPRAKMWAQVRFLHASTRFSGSSHSPGRASCCVVGPFHVTDVDGYSSVGLLDATLSGVFRLSVRISNKC